MTLKQQEAITLLLIKKRAALFLKPGSGKTFACLEAVKQLDLKKILVISTSLICKKTWPSEVEKFNSEVELFTIIAHHTNIESFNEKVDAVIIDEGTLFKNAQSRRFKAVIRLLNHLQPKHVWVLTGTPHPQSMLDLWPQIYLLDGGKRLGTYSQFIQRFFKPQEFGKPLAIRKDAEKKIYELISDLCVVGEVPKDLLPSAVDYKVDIILPKGIKEVYSFLIENACLPGDPEVVELTDLIVNNAYIKLRQLVQGIADRFESDYRVQELQDLRGRCIIYTKFIKEHERLVEAYKQKSYYFSSSTPIDERAKILNEFERDERDDIFLIVPYQLVAHGLNIQNSADTIVWYSLPESLEYYLQANARLVRPGRERGDVKVIHLVSDSNVDISLYKRLKSREEAQQNLFEYFKKKN